MGDKMILRKPYAFLIKHFKLLHLIMCALLVYIVFKANDMLYYFTEYINAGYYIKIGDVVGDYISIYLYLALFIVLAINLIIIVLLHTKEKTNISYELIFVIYIIVAALIVNGHINLLNMQLEVIDYRKIRLFRDIFFISMFAQYISIIFTLIRGLGFNIKKFDFDKEADELEITSSDNEEFEFSVNLNTNAFARKMRSRRRHLRYFFVEHKPLLTFFGTLVVIAASVIAFINIGTTTFMHKENTTVKINDNTIAVNRSYLTEYDYLGKTINKNYAYLVVNFDIKNTGTTPTNLELSKFKLLMGNTIYSPITTEETKFFDFGEYYKENKLKEGVAKNFILVFQIPIQEKNNKKYVFRYNASQTKNGNITDKNFDIKLSPITSFLDQELGQAKINEELSLSQSILWDTKIKINSYEINDSFTTSYKYCITNTTCEELSTVIVPQDLSNNSKTVLKLDLDITYDSKITSSNITNKSNLISKLGKISYVYENNNYQDTKLINLTPTELQNNNTIYLEVDSKIKQSDNLKLILDIRGSKYTYILSE